MLLWVVCLCGLILPSGEAIRDLPKAWKDDITSLEDPIKQIRDYVEGDYKNTAFNRLAKLTDIYGPRISGSQELEDAIDYLKAEMQAEFGDNNVGTDDVEVPRWVRGEEKAWMMIPRDGLPDRRHDMSVMTIGTSVGTGGLDVTGEVVVVNSLAELDGCNTTENMAKLEDKIIVFNQDWPENGYSGVFMYRGEGGHRSEHCEAKAALVRSLTQYSINSPHTGSQSQTLTSTMPAVCITVEDAELLDRLTNTHGLTINVTLNLEAENKARSMSRNLWAQINGTEKQEEFVIFGGHIDSWDVGVGAMDDGGGVIVSWQALSIVKNLVESGKIPAPKRTMKAIFWTAEEIDSSGANDFYEKNKEESISLIMESDAGTFSPTGIGFQGSGLARSILEEVMEYVSDINAGNVTEDMSGSVDLRPWLTGKPKLPAAVLNNVQDEYFKFHHTDGDTMTVEDPAELDRCSIMWTSAAYSVALLHDVLPQDGEYIPDPDRDTSSAVTSFYAAWERGLVFTAVCLLAIFNF